MCENLGADPWVVSAIKEGYNLKFHHKPPLTSQPKFNQNGKHPQVNTEIKKKNMDKERVHNINTRLLQQNFLVPKKLGQRRIIEPVIFAELFGGESGLYPSAYVNLHVTRNKLKSTF